tara:strand:+ start:46 stop:681 length:636 start_codon:yes stop_codon:yes gene_type:complete
MALVTSKSELPFQNFDHIIYVNRDFYQDPPLPLRSGRSNFSGGAGGVLSAEIIGHDELLGAPVTYTIGAMHPDDRAFGAYYSGISGTNTTHNSGITLSAIAVAYNYKPTDTHSGGLSGISLTTRKLYLSAGPRHGSQHHEQCSLLTTISATFTLGLVFPDNTINTYHIPSGNVTSHDRGGAQSNPLTAVQYRADDVASDPNTRRKVQLGYL